MVRFRANRMLYWGEEEENGNYYRTKILEETHVLQMPPALTEWPET